MKDFGHGLSQAKDSGNVSVHDVLVSVNGIPVAHLPFHEVIEVIRFVQS